MTPARDALSVVLPPLSLVTLIQEVLRRKALRGDPIPEGWVRWLGRVEAWRKGQVGEPVSVLTESEWNEVAEMEF